MSMGTTGMGLQK